LLQQEKVLKHCIRLHPTTFASLRYFTALMGLTFFEANHQPALFGCGMVPAAFLTATNACW
jgi:hypothetical protein